MATTLREKAEQKAAMQEIARGEKLTQTRAPNAVVAAQQTTSTRQHDELAKFNARPETLVAPDKREMSTKVTTAAPQRVGRVRERLEQEVAAKTDAAAEKKDAPNAAVQAVGDYYFALYQQEQAREKATETADIASGRLKIIR